MNRRAVLSRRTNVALVALLVTVLAVITRVATAADVVTINGAGATLPQTILATGITNNPSYISTFQTLTNNQVAVTYNGTGSNIADDLIVHGGSAIDFGVSDAPLTDAEVTQLRAPVLHVPITLTALEFIYNLPDDQISGPLNLTADVVARIYMRQITKWDDPAIRQSNPRLTYNGPIAAVVRSDGSGSTYVVSEFLSLAASVWPYGTARTIQWPAGVTPALYTSRMVTTVKATVGAIGYARWGVAAESGLQGAQLKNSAGYWTRPSVESVLAPCLDHSPDYGGLGLPSPSESWAGFSLVNEAGHSTYPLVTFSYALVYKDMSAMGERGAAVLNLLHFINLEATQNQALAFHFVPLPLYVRQANEKTLQSVSLAFGNSPLQYYNPYVAKGGNRTAAILSLILSLAIVLGLLALIAKEIHAHFGQDPSRGIY